LSIVLAEKNKVIGEKSIVVNGIIKDITEKSETATIQAKAATEKKEILDKQAIIIAREDAHATKALEEAIPALQEAELAVADISRPAITEI
jgi:dynein heavy chain